MKQRQSTKEALASGVKTCTMCKVEMPVSGFKIRTKRGKRVLRSRCQECELQYHREYRDANRDKIRKRCRDWHRVWSATPKGAREKLRHDLKHSFGITLDDYDRMVFEQGGKCAICGDMPVPGVHKNGRRRNNSRLCVDHDHTTGRVRALLCQPCNAGVGYFRENPEALESAAAYVRKHNEG